MLMQRPSLHTSSLRHSSTSVSKTKDCPGLVIYFYLCFFFSGYKVTDSFYGLYKYAYILFSFLPSPLLLLLPCVLLLPMFPFCPDVTHFSTPQPPFFVSLHIPCHVFPSDFLASDHTHSIQTRIYIHTYKARRCVVVYKRERVMLSIVSLTQYFPENLVISLFIRAEKTYVTNI